MPKSQGATLISRVAVINIDDKALTGRPSLEVFASGGLVTKLEIGEIPAYATRHYLLSELASGKIGPHDLTLRLVDEHATRLMSVVHLDYVRRDLRWITLGSVFDIQ